MAASSASSIIFIIFLVSVSLIFSVSDSINCPSVKCGHDSPDIRFPFYCQGLQNQTCGLSGFGLSCNHRKNTTLIQFPEYNSGELEVKSISYDEKKLILVDPTNCIPRVFLNLDHLMINRLTPFKYYYITHNFTYLNCSQKLISKEEVPCLSSSGRHVYVITSESSSSVVPNSSCRPLKTVSIPFSYSHYLSDNTFGLRLTWDHQDQEVVSNGQHEIVDELGMNLGALISMAAAMTLILFCLKSYSQSIKDLAVKEWRMMMKMRCQTRDLNNQMNEPNVKITMRDNSDI